MDLFLHEKFTTLRVRQRANADADGMIVVDLPRGRHVRMQPAEWHAIESDYRTEIRGTARLLAWSVPLAFPFSLAVFAVVANVPALGAMLDAIGNWFGLVLVLICSALPLTALAWHQRAVRRAQERLFRRAAKFPRAEQLPPRAPPGLHAIEWIALVLVGPHLLVQLWGTLNPNAFRNTPWTGAHLDLSGYAGIAVLMLIGALRLPGWLRYRRSRAPMEPAEPALAASPSPRLGSVLARARQSGSD